jgi:hypothetical protein
MVQPIQPMSHLSQPTSQHGRYFNLQVSAWTNFDPSSAELTEIARAIEEGNGFLSVIEVTRVVDNVGEIDDPEIRQRFETVLAAERLLDGVSELPQSLKDKLYAALARDQQDEQRLAG